MDLKALWEKQEGSVPDSIDLIRKAREFRRGHVRRLMLLNVLLLSTSAFIVWVWVTFQPEMITTKAGIVLAVTAMVLYLLVYNRMLPLLSHVDYGMDNSRYLQHLLRLKEKQRFLQTTMLRAYFVLLSAGLCLYMFEYASRMTLLWGVSSYGVTLLLVGVHWFYFRPRSIRKEQDQIDTLIHEFEELRKQLRDE